MFKPFAKSLLATVAVVGLALPSAWAKEAEVLHWWTSGGEAAALKVLKDDFASNGGTWKDMPIAGGGGDAAMQTLKARIVAGDPPGDVISIAAGTYNEHSLNTGGKAITIGSASGNLDVTIDAQQGGNVLIDPGGIVRCHHIGRGPADRPSVRVILAARSGLPQNSRF